MALQLDLLTCIELDPRTIQLTVRERWSERRLFWNVEHERERTYTLQIGVGCWHDGDHFILSNDARHFRLWELFAASRIERKLDAFVFAPEPIKYTLPPVPVLPKR